MAKSRGVPIWVLVVVPALAATLLLMAAPLFLRERDGRPNVCLSNVKWIAIAIQMYASDNDDHLPPAAAWCDELDEYVKNRDVFRCPSARGKSGWDYAYNSVWSGRAFLSVQAVGPSEAQWFSDNRVVVFESDAGRNASGDHRLLPAVPRHLGGDNYGFADGSAMWLARKSEGEDRRGERIWLKETVRGDVTWKP